MWKTFTEVFSNTVGKHNKDANDWFGPNSWWAKLTGKGGAVISDEVGRDIATKAQEGLVTKVIIGFLVYKAFID